MSARGKYFNLQFNRDCAGEAEFEAKLRKMAKDNNLTMTDTVRMLVMAVDQFKISYNVNVDLTEAKVQSELSQKKKIAMGSVPHSDEKPVPAETQQEVQHSILDALKDKR